MSKHLILLFAAEFQKLSYELQQEVYRDFYVLVYPMVNFIVKDHGETENIIQEAFMRSIRKSDQLLDWEKLESWLKTLTRNVTLNFLRKIKRNHDELDMDSVFDHSEISAGNQSMPIELEVETKLMEESIVQYLAQLKPEYRHIFEMRWLQNLSYKEMAAVLEVSESIVKQKLFRAREAIKLRIKNDWSVK